MSKGDCCVSLTRGERTSLDALPLIMSVANSRYRKLLVAVKILLRILWIEADDP